MTQQEKKEVIRVCGPNYEPNDIPAFIRKRDEKKEKLSVCCNAPLIGGAQCETCGADGRDDGEFEIFETKKVDKNKARARAAMEDEFNLTGRSMLKVE